MRVFLLMLVPFVLSGVVVGLAALVASLFQDGPRAEYTRMIALGALLLSCALGIVRAALVLLTRHFRH